MLALLALLREPLVPVVSAPFPSRPSTFQVVELDVDPRTTFRNPFDPTEVAVEGIFVHADGTRLIVPGFWAGKGFKLRFSPPKAGSWRLTTSVVTAEGRGSVGTTFTVKRSNRLGFVRSKGRYLCSDNGKTFFPIGLNLCWPDQRGLASYDARFAKLASVGGNFARIWTTQERRIETEKAGIGRYDLAAADFYDGIFKLAEKHGIRLMYTFDDYRVLAKTDFFNAHWDKSPYNAANHGPLKEPTQFFSDPDCRRLYKQKLRYLVARYGAYPSIALWEIWNEQDNIPEPGVPTEWFREMTAYLREIDPYKHLITTSYSWQDKAEIWESPALGLTQRHFYGQGDTVDFVGDIVRNAPKMAAFDKPTLLGEFGITWKESDIALDKARLGTPLHDALWATTMVGNAGGAMTWWWDNYLEPLNLWSVYTGLSKFVVGIDFAHRDFRPLSLSVPGLTTLALQDEKSHEILLWLHDPDSNWKADAEKKEPRVWSGVSIPMPGSWAVEVWDTRTGVVIHKGRARDRIVLPDFRRDVALKLKPV
jgi:hypothetical protein